MRATDLERIFRRVVLASLTASNASALSGCYVSLAPADPPADASTDVGADVPRDVSTDDGPPWHSCPVITRGDGPDGSVTCMSTVMWVCGGPMGVTIGEPVDSTTCGMICPRNDSGRPAFSCSVNNEGGPALLSCNYCRAGRRTEGLAEPALCEPTNALGSYLATTATLEAASVIAFERLRDELRAHGAPDELLTDLARAADEERDHAARVSNASRRRGIEPEVPRFAGLATTRSVWEIARENVVEGCVRETFGALLATWQAQHATDHEIATLHAHLAMDETRHAALSWRLHAWLSARLTPAENEALLRVRNDAFDALRGEARTEPALELVRDAGMPDALATQRLLDELARALWAEAG